MLDTAEAAESSEAVEAESTEATEETATPQIDPQQVSEMQKALEAQQQALENLQANNAKLLEEKKKEKEKQQKAREAATAALEEQGKFRELADARKSEIDELKAQLAELNEAAAKASDLESRLSGYESTARERAQMRINSWPEESKAKFVELFPNYDTMDPLDISAKAETYEKSFIAAAKDARKQQPNGAGARTTSEMVSREHNGSAGANRMKLITESLGLDLGLTPRR